jgi:aspartate aminotransferase
VQFASKNLGGISLSASVAIQTRALEMRAAGEEVIALSAGEPDFDTPRHICEAAARAIADGKTRYTAVDGTPELKEAVRGKFYRENRLEFRQDEISISAGGKQAIYNALAASLDPGDEVIVIAPYWVSYPDMVRLCGGRPVVVETRAVDGFLPDPERIRAAITPRTRWLILNSPGNPSGAVLPERVLVDLARVLERQPHVGVICDDIYEHLVYAPAAFLNLLNIAPELADRTLVVNGVSKTYAMTGWRIGYAAGPRELIRAMRTVQSQSTGNPCSISQWAAVAALDTPALFLGAFLQAFRARREMVSRALNAIPGIDCPLPDGAFYVYPAIAGLIGRETPDGVVIDDDAVFAAQLLEQQKVAVVHGGAYGLSPHFRISYAASEDELERACARIDYFCRSLA